MRSPLYYLNLTSIILFGAGAGPYPRHSAQALEQPKTFVCHDLKESAFAHAMFARPHDQIDQTAVKFLVYTRQNRKGLTVDCTNCTRFTSAPILDLQAKTFVIIHGYRSGGTKRWPQEMKESLLDAIRSNVIIVDWQEGSAFKNYVRSASHIEVVAQHIVHFLHHLQLSYAKLATKPQWNHFHFIGHSLGAHLSGIAAANLKVDPFYQIERITGLDPAQPCFKNIDLAFRLDPSDADYVDVIHTQMGKTEGFFASFGIRDPIGHADFYVNGGVKQPSCVVSSKSYKMICSHKAAYRYFIESIKNLVNSKCKYLSYPWDGTLASAEKAVKATKSNHECPSCPEMGIKASSGDMLGVFINFAGRKEPFCEYDDEDLAYALKMVQKMQVGLQGTGKKSIL
ncbi:hypothetical protein TKK_0009337 [Trichogramma kaykai]